MKISKKQAMKFACYEYEQRKGEWEPLEDEPDWTLEDQVTQDGELDLYKDNPASAIATLRYDGYGNDDIKWNKKFYGEKLWQAALEAYWKGDFDT